MRVYGKTILDRSAELRPYRMHRQKRATTLMADEIKRQSRAFHRPLPFPKQIFNFVSSCIADPVDLLPIMHCMFVDGLSASALKVYGDYGSPCRHY